MRLTAPNHSIKGLFFNLHMKVNSQRILFGLSSCKKFARKTLPKSIGSLVKVGISPASIVCAVGGFESKEDSVNLLSELPGITGCNNIVYTPYNSLEYNVFLYLLDNQDTLKDFDYLFFMHDTCWVGDKFLLFLQSHFPSNLPDTFSLTPWPSMGIGLYKISHLLSKANLIRAAENTSTDFETEQRVKKWGVEAEDMLFIPECGNFMRASGGKETITLDYPFDPNTPRRVRYFPYLDFYKAQANFLGVQPEMITDA